MSIASVEWTKNCNDFFLKCRRNFEQVNIRDKIAEIREIFELLNNNIINNVTSNVQNYLSCTFIKGRVRSRWIPKD